MQSSTACSTCSSSARSSSCSSSAWCMLQQMDGEQIEAPSCSIELLKRHDAADKLQRRSQQPNVGDSMLHSAAQLCNDAAATLLAHSSGLLQTCWNGDTVSGTIVIDISNTAFKSASLATQRQRAMHTEQHMHGSLHSASGLWLICIIYPWNIDGCLARFDLCLVDVHISRFAAESINVASVQADSRVVILHADVLYACGGSATRRVADCFTYPWSADGGMAIFDTCIVDMHIPRSLLQPNRSTWQACRPIRAW